MTGSPDDSPAAAADRPADADTDRAAAGVARRGFLRGTAAALAGAVVGGAAGWGAAELTHSGSAAPATPSADGDAPRAARVDPHGAHQAGIDRPATPQRFGVLVAVDLDGIPASADAAFRTRLQGLLKGLGETITALTAPAGDPAGEKARLAASLPDGPGDLTVTIGLGPAPIAAVDGSLPGAQRLASFAGDGQIPAERQGGDLLVAAYSSDPNDAGNAALAVVAASGGRMRWLQRGFRAPGTGTITRNPLSFHDGVIVPHGKTELDENVWIAKGPLAGGSICVFRRLRLDVPRFHAQSVAEREQIIGRRLVTGSPLSGGGPTAEVDVEKKTAEGNYVIPLRAHVRAAHPSFTGSALMFRRGYAFDDGLEPGTDVHDTGLLFICFQHDLRTFEQTQFRLDEVDDLMGYATPTGTATFAILPGFTPQRPLGASLFAS